MANTESTNKEINCNIPNDKLDDNEWKRIEEQCKSQKHIDKNDDIKKIIAEDEKTLEKLGITFQQLKDFFRKIKLRFAHNLHLNKYKLEDWETKLANTLKIGGRGWCCRNSPSTTIFQKYTVIRISWGGAEICPFQSPYDKRYHGYEYGSHDWIFINRETKKCIHIGDLLFHQIIEHHFFQSKTSGYRVDPKELVNFFGLTGKKDYTTKTEIKYYWRSNIYISKKWKNNYDYDYEMKYIKSTIDKIDSQFDNLKIEKEKTYTIYYDENVAFLFCYNDGANLPNTINGIEFGNVFSKFKGSSGGIEVFRKCDYDKIAENEKDEI